jgi:ABC-type nitrate/sulfonate/bicarbonate transport system substrate-binding protein
MRVHQAFLSLAVAIAGLAGGGDGFAQEKVAIGMATGVNQVPSLVAQDQGFFADEGLEVELKPLARGALAIEAIAGGSLQFAESAHAPTLAAIAGGIPIHGVAVAARGFYGKLIAKPEHSDLDSLEDFVGMRVGTQVGTGMHLTLAILLEERGITEEQLGITNLRVADMPAAMATGDFDAVIGWEPGMQRIVQAGEGVEIITARDFEELAEISYPFILSAQQQLVEESPETVQKVANAYSKAHKFIRENPDEAVRIYKEFVDSTGADLDEETIRYMMFDTDRFGGVAFSERDWRDLKLTRDYMIKTGQLPETALEIEAVMSREFGETAEAAVQ